VKYEWNGVPIREISFEATFTDSDGLEQFRAIEMERDWTIWLAPGERWPDECKRGRSVEFTMHADGIDRQFSGTVKYRRLNKLVLHTS
jgi:hypothetical protein